MLTITIHNRLVENHAVKIYKRIQTNMKHPFMNYLKRPETLFFAFLILISAYRLTLTTAGHLYWIDELRYLNAFLTLDNWHDGNWKTGFSYLFKESGRPLYIVFCLLPALLQLWLSDLGKISISNENFFPLLYDQGKASQVFDPQFFNIPSILNVCVIALGAGIFLKILELVFDNPKTALAGSVIYALLANTNTYIRHLFPYDLSLAIFLWALWLILKKLKEGCSLKTAVVCGILSACGFLMYPGYWPFVIIIFIMTVTASRHKAKAFLGYSISAFSVLALIQLVSFYSGESFVKDSLGLSGSIIQGNFEEGFAFLPRYLMEVEGLSGWMIMVFSALGTLIVYRKESKSYKIFISSAIGTYLLYGALSAFLHKMVFYGRIIHMFIPFVIILTLMPLKHALRPQWNHFFIILMIITSLCSFFSFHRQYNKISYPSDFYFEHLAALPNDQVCRTHELKGPVPVDRCLALTVNTLHLHPIFPFHNPVENPKGMTLIAVKAHPLNFPAYQFEGYPPEERQRLKERKYQMRIYVRDFLSPAFE